MSSLTGQQNAHRATPVGLLRTTIALICMVVVATNVVLIGSVLNDKSAIQEKALALVPPGESEGEIVRRLSAFVRDEIHHLSRDEVLTLSRLQQLNYFRNPFHVGPKTVLDHGGDPGGACGSSSRVLMELLAAHDVESRFVIIKGGGGETHTVLEVFYEGEWGAVDPLYDIVYTHPAGKPASLDDLRSDETLFLRNAEMGWQYGKGPNRREQIIPYNAGKYPFREAHYFNFDKFGPVSRALRRMIRTTFGEDATLWVKRPNFYAYPALTTTVVLDFMLATACLSWFGARAVLRRSRARHGRCPTD